MGNTGRATSFFNFKFDRGIVHDLTRVVTDAKQAVPEWLGAGGRAYHG